MAKKKKAKVKKIDSLEVARQAILKKYGEGVISPLGDHEDLQIDSVSTGSLALDSALGVGGMARGRLHEVYGPNSSGKSSLALSVCMKGLQRSLNVAYVDAEHALDPKLVRNMGKAMGVDADIIDLVQGYTGDDNLEISEILMKSGELDILVVDSVSALLPKQMAEGDIGDDYIGLLARLMSKACLKLTPIANRTNTLLIFINQIRHSIGKWGDDRITSGGEALGFYTTTRTRVQGGETASSRIVDDSGVVIGHASDFLIIKNKLSAPWRKSQINLIYGVGYDFVEEVVSLAVDVGVIDQQGAWYYYGDNKWQGRANISKVFREDEGAYEKLRKSVKDMLGLGGE